MNGRTPNSFEKLYIDLSLNIIGCVACILEGIRMDNPNGSWIAFHHDPDFGSKKPWCHLHGFGLCKTHHQGIGAYSFVPVRHPPLSSKHHNFKAEYGSDSALCKINWTLINHHIPEIKKNVMVVCPFTDIEQAI